MQELVNEQQREHVRTGDGFIAALDQSGGSTPTALRQYGVMPEAYNNDEEMFSLIHEMRSRIVTAPSFSGQKVVGAILFEMTMDREINGKPAAVALWDDHGVVPFLKVDKGLCEAVDGVQLMKPIDSLDRLLTRAKVAGIFGTKMRSVIGAANADGIAAVVAQQFEIGQHILSYGLMPILEPEVTISIADKAEAEDLLLIETTRQLDALPEGVQVMLKLTLPECPNQYLSLVNHPKVLRIVALSGGYDREEANMRLSQNTGIIASFSRALTEGLSADQDDAAFNLKLSAAIDAIHAASVAG